MKAGQLNSYCGRYPSWLLCLLVVLVNCLLFFLCRYLLPAFHYPFDRPSFGMVEKYLLAGVFLPVAFAVAFQKYFLSVALELTDNAVIAALVTGLLYGAGHYWSLRFVLPAFVFGTLYSLLYQVIAARNQPALACVAVTACLVNLCILSFPQAAV
ncbi:MAG: hypothetical protein QM664_12020 [Flavihumibacter sp.]